MYYSASFHSQVKGGGVFGVIVYNSVINGGHVLKNIRDPFSGLSHLISAVFAFLGAIALLIWGWGDIGKQAALLIYGISLVLMFGSSAAYHMASASPRVIQRLRKLDHLAIYLLIAGTYTPICVQFLEGTWRWAILGAVWGMALVGVIVKLFVINAPRWLTAGVYLVMGWMAILAGREMLVSVPAPALAWIFAGGLLFTVGAVIYITKKPDPLPGVFGFHEIWHIFVTLGCLSFFIAIAVYVAIPKLI